MELRRDFQGLIPPGGSKTPDIQKDDENLNPKKKVVSKEKKFFVRKDKENEKPVCRFYNQGRCKYNLLGKEKLSFCMLPNG